MELNIEAEIAGLETALEHWRTQHATAEATIPRLEGALAFLKMKLASASAAKAETVADPATPGAEGNPAEPTVSHPHLP